MGGLHLRNPVLAASGTFGYGTEVLLLDRRHLGGMVSKGIFLEPRAGNPPPRIAETAAGMLNAIGLQGPGVEALISDYAPLWASWDFPVLVNINAERVETYGELAARLDGVPGISGLEVNISCPNVRQGGMFFGSDPQAAGRVTAAVRRHTRLPIWVKLTPQAASVGEVARAVEAEGADAVCAINTLAGTIFDSATGLPALAFGHGGLSGPAILPVALYLARAAAAAVKIPVVGVGGIGNGEDALQFLFAGCSAVQVGTATFLDPQAIEHVARGLQRLLASLPPRAEERLLGLPAAPLIELARRGFADPERG